MVRCVTDHRRGLILLTGIRICSHGKISARSQEVTHLVDIYKDRCPL